MPAFTSSLTSAACGAGLKTFQGLRIKPSSSTQTNSTEGESVYLCVFLGGNKYIGASLFNGKQREQAGFNPLEGSMLQSKETNGTR